MTDLLHRIDKFVSLKNDPVRILCQANVAAEQPYRIMSNGKGLYCFFKVWQGRRYVYLEDPGVKEPFLKLVYPTYNEAGWWWEITAVREGRPEPPQHPTHR